MVRRILPYQTKKNSPHIQAWAKTIPASILFSAKTTGRKAKMMRDEVEIMAGWQPGAIGDIVAMHSRYYALHWNFGPYFEARVATELAAFVRDRHRYASNLWCAVDRRERMIGSVAIDGAKGLEAGAHLRWFMVDPDRQGMGAGSRLLDTALEFCREKGFASVHLWTFAGLFAARRLYEARGFVLTQELAGETWGKPVTEQCFTLELSPQAA